MTEKAKTYIARRKWLRLIAAQGGVPELRKTYTRGVIPGGIRRKPATATEAGEGSERKEAKDEPWK